MSRRHTPKTKGSKSPRALNRSDGKMKRWNNRSDIPLDEDDQFHAARDQILLDRAEASDDEDDEEEVFALKGLSDDSHSSEDDNEQEQVAYAMDDDEAPAKAKKASSKKVKGVKPPQSSSSVSESEEEEEAWGRTKSAYYSSNAAQLDSDDEEANEMEEQEAKRLQAKVRDAMTEDDFGLGDVVGVSEETEITPPETQPQASLALPQDKIASIRHLEKFSPEALALTRDWDDVAHTIVKARERISLLETDDPESVILGMAHLHFQALLTYATTLAFYLHLRASEKYSQRPDLLRTHPILPRLLTLKQGLATLEELDFGLDSDDNHDDNSENDMMSDAYGLWGQAGKNGLDLGELQSLLMDADTIISSAGDAGQKPSAKKTKTSTKESPKKKRKTSANPESAQPSFDLTEPDFSTSKTRSKTRDTEVTDVYGEASSLQASDAADKQARRKSLRFHTARIESVSARRQSARGAVGGDDDIPYRERKKVKEARLQRETAASRGLGGDDLNDAEPEPRKRPREENNSESDNESGDGYYELIQRKSRDKKDEKKTAYEAVQAAARPNINEETADGPRSLTRAILKNKGLTPYRGKSVRNPRVKKRQKYEKAKKKVSSQKATYKGGISSTGKYTGEQSGISRVVKSVRL